MGIFAETAWFRHNDCNKENTSLTAYYTKRSSWHLVITRKNHDLDNIPLERVTRKTATTTSYETPSERYWENVPCQPYHAIYLVPWNVRNENDPRQGMIAQVDNTRGPTMRLWQDGDYMRLHAFLSEIQYPFLADIRRRHVENAQYGGLT